MAERIGSDKMGMRLQRPGTRSDDEPKPPRPSDTAPHNVTDSYLSFRQQTDEGTNLPYDNCVWKAGEKMYGFENWLPAIQNLGKVLTRQSRLLCFPNVMQHRVSPFQLADPSKPGHRKILALFLVDPHLKIISTENVPPQQESWWRQEVRDAGVFERVPLELAEIVVRYGGSLVSLEKAREQRCELVEERNQSIQKPDEDFVNLRSFNVSCAFVC
ncbi:MAG: hypothetical protein Q9223_001906 [Gallowayella weberi]